MNIDLSSFAFGYKIESGGGTPNWATSLGQGRDYKIKSDINVEDILTGMIYKSVSLSSISTKIGKGGREVLGNSLDSPIVLAAVFEKVYINDVLVENGKFILLLTRDTSDSHRGRLRLKYGPSNKFLSDTDTFDNATFFDLVRQQFNMNNDACWFVYSINIRNQDELVLSTIIVDYKDLKTYSSVKEQHNHWVPLIEQHSGIDSFHENEDLLSDFSYQRIFFGAPGTGKSYKLKQAAEEHFAGHYARVTFHPNYMYGNFVGQYKPYPAEDNPEKITYRFVPGVLLTQLVEALKNPQENFLVIIEEINRANVAAVFGDLFQLLDRDGTGNSEYSISTTKEVQDYLRNEAFKDISLDLNVEKRLGDEFSNLYLPNNLFIWATMNSADQGVMPMDTAFKRRWEFEYTDVNEIPKSDSGRFESYYFEMSSGAKYSWNEYREAVNAKLSKLNIAEDKLLGPYFITKSILESDDKKHITAVIKNKVLMYLYEDAAKAYRGKLFAEGIYGTYSQLCKAFDNNPLTIFAEAIDIDEVESKVSREEKDGD